MTIYKITACAVAALAIAVAPVSSASAHYYHHGVLFGVGAVGAAIVGTAGALLAAPFVALSAAVPRAPAYYAPPGYYAPPPAYYAPPPGYYAPPPAYYAPPPTYYAPPGYYPPR